LGVFRAAIGSIAHMFAFPFAVEVALGVDQLPIEVEHDPAAGGAIVGDRLLPGFVAALLRIGDPVGIRISVVHAAVPPAERKSHVYTDAFSRLPNALVQVVVSKQGFAVLMPEYDSLPSHHL